MKCPHCLDEKEGYAMLEENVLELKCKDDLCQCLNCNEFFIVKYKINTIIVLNKGKECAKK